MDPNPQSLTYNRQPPPKDVDPPRQRIDVACQRCRRRKIKCSGWTENEPRCLGCIKAEHACEFVNRPAPIIVPQNAQQGAIASTGYTRPWSPSTPTFATSPRHGGPLAGTHRRSTQGYHPYPPQQSPTGMTYSPTFMMTPWMQQGQQQSPQDIADTYSGTGFHHLVDQSAMQRQPKSSDLPLESPTVISHGSLAQRRVPLHREGSYNYTTDNQSASPLPSPIATPIGVSQGKVYASSQMIPREDSAYAKLLYTPIHPTSTPQVQTHAMTAASLHPASSQIQSVSPQSHIIQSPSNFSPLSATSTASGSSQAYTPSQPQPTRAYSDPSQTRFYAQDPTQRQHYFSADSHPQSSEFAIPPNPRRHNLGDLSAQSSSPTSAFTYSQSTQSPIDYSNLTPYPRPTDRYPSPYQTPEVRSRPSSRTSLTPQTLAEHTHVQDTIHEQHVDAAKSALAVDNGTGVQVMEYLDTIPQRPPPQAAPEAP